MNTFQIIIVAVFLILPWFVFMISKSMKRKKIEQCYKKIAERYSLSIGDKSIVGAKSYPSAEGTYRNRSVYVESFMKSNGRKEIPHTRISVGCDNSKGLQFVIANKTSANKLIYINGAVKIDDEEFDRNFIINTNNVEALKTIFNFNSKFKIAQARDLGLKGEVRLDGNVLQYIDSDFINNDTYLMRAELMLHELCDLADEMKYL